MSALDILTYFVWLISAVTFIIALKFLASPRTARTGNLLGALRHGLPALVLPQGADQFVNGARLVEVGAGRALEGDALTADAVAEAVAAMLPEDSAERRAARELAAEMARMPAPSDVVPVLEHLAARGGNQDGPRASDGV